MSYDELGNYILYVSGQSKNKQNKTGSRAIIDILEMAGLVENNDGKLIVSSKGSNTEKTKEIIQKKLEKANKQKEIGIEDKLNSTKCYCI